MANALAPRVNTMAVGNALAGRGGELRAWQPGIMDNVRNYAMNALAPLFGGDVRAANAYYRDKIQPTAEYLPGVGDLMAAGEAKDAFSAGDYLGGSLLAAGAAAGLVPGVGDVAQKGIKKGIRAYHGSPHDFDKFSMDKIGTGEGAQAYGHGLYFADSEDVARSYRDNLSQRGAIGAKNIVRPENVSDDEFAVVSSSLGRFWGQWNPSELVGQMQKSASEIDETRRYVDQLIERRKELRDAMPDIDGGMFAKMDEEINRYQNAVSQMEEYQKAADIIEKRGGIDAFVPKGRMYEVNINANPDDFLDWDKPLSEQPEKIRQAMGLPLASREQYDAIINEMEKIAQVRDPKTNRMVEERKWMQLARDRDELGAMLGAEKSGQKAYDTYSMGFGGGREDAARALKEAGIPGIKYLDAGSRSAGDGSRNYVVFDDSLIEILRKYGVLPAAIGTGAFMQMMQDDPQKAQELHNFATSVRDGA